MKTCLKGSRTAGYDSAVEVCRADGRYEARPDLVYEEAKRRLLRNSAGASNSSMGTVEESEPRWYERLAIRSAIH